MTFEELHVICILYKNSTFLVDGPPVIRVQKSRKYLLEISKDADRLWIYLERIPKEQELYAKRELYCHLLFDTVFPGKILFYCNINPNKRIGKMLMSSSIMQLSSHYSQMHGNASEDVITTFVIGHKKRVKDMADAYVKEASLGPSFSIETIVDRERTKNEHIDAMRRRYDKK